MEGSDLFEEIQVLSQVLRAVRRAGRGRIESCARGSDVLFKVEDRSYFPR